MRNKGLSRIENMVCILVCQDLSSAEIGHRMGISKRTVEIHISTIYKKLGILTQKETLKRMMKTKNTTE
jgi:DNA-binding CsgD family transcriptional regulator